MNFVRSFSLPKPVPGCTYAVFRLAVPRSRAGQLDYNTTRASLCQHLFSIFSTNFSLPFWALCILLSAAHQTTRGGFLGAGGGWAAAARCFHCPQRSWLRERSPGGLQAAPTSNGKSDDSAETPPLPERSCGGVKTPPYKPTEDPTDRKTAIIRQSGEIHNNSKPKPQIASSLLYGSPWGPPGKLAKVLLAVWLPRAYTGSQNTTGMGIANDEDLPYKG